MKTVRIDASLLAAEDKTAVVGLKGLRHAQKCKGFEVGELQAIPGIAARKAY